MKLKEILLSDNIVKSINDNLDYILKIIPEIKYMIGFDHRHPHHHLDVWNHTLLALSISPCNLEIRLALLLHDIGKPFSYQDGDIRHFHNHPNISEYMSREILNRLEFNCVNIDDICSLIKYHDTKICKEEIKNNISYYKKLAIIQYCDALAHNPTKLEKRINYLLEIFFSLKEYEMNDIENMYKNILRMKNN